MGASKKYFVTMLEREYMEIPSLTRNAFLSDKVVYDDYDLYKDDEVFQQLYRAKRKAVKALDDWKYDQRNK